MKHWCRFVLIHCFILSKRNIKLPSSLTNLQGVLAFLIQAHTLLNQHRLISVLCVYARKGEFGGWL